MELTKHQFKSDFIKKLAKERGKNIDEATHYDKYYALGCLIRDYVAENWVKTNQNYAESEKKQVYYFCIEFLMGKLLICNLINLGIKEICEESLKELGMDLDEIKQIETDQGLGSGGLGRLAACFLDSMASLQIPGHGFGIRYNYGLFEQKIVDGYQTEFSDRWLEHENVWEVKKPSESIVVKFGGCVKASIEENRLKFKTEDCEEVLALPYDTPILGYKNDTVNTLRLWNAKAVKKEIDYDYFNIGNYNKAFKNKCDSEAISCTLYPNDSHESGRLLRLKQEYFLVSAGIQSIIKSYKKSGKSISNFNKYNAIHINDTHPALAVPELMRILMDEENMEWNEAWKITTNTISYTNHTIMEEALEKWDVYMFKELLPRIYMIVEEINNRFCHQLSIKYDADFDKIKRMKIIGDGYVKMAYLSIVGSHSVNGVAKLHTEILKHQELKYFYELYPYKFNNKTNGINHRRWLLKANPMLSNLIIETIGDKWIEETNELKNLLKYKNDSIFKEKIHEVKQHNKSNIADFIKKECSIDIDPNSIYDVHIKRIHEYKRQLLNVFHIMHLYNSLLENPNLDIHPRTFIFGGKSSPSYYIAKKTIKLINTLSQKINNDKTIQDKLKVVFLENYGVTIAENLIPASNVSEQISTTTKEASGTGNMKFMMNGAIAIGTLDGANIEIRDAVGNDNIVIFGLKAQEVLELYSNRTYRPLDIYNENIKLKKVLNQLVNGFFDVREDEFSSIYNSLLMGNDPFFVLKDFDSYEEAHKKIDNLYKNKSKWLEMSIENIANSGVFSSDKTIIEYNKDIWKSGL